jgi:L-erythrulose 1-phosphate isomerase
MTAQRILLGTNWKMHKTVREATEYTVEFLKQLETIEGLDLCQLFILPPFTSIAAIKRVSNGRFWVGAQNMHWADSGPYTGEVSAQMLHEIGVDLVELGHAERRQHFNETDADVNRKVAKALEWRLRPLICLGESLEEREFGVERESVARQLKFALHGVTAEGATRILLAYEPVWSIGHGGAAAEPAHVSAIVEHLRETLAALFDAELAGRIPILYGGDVTPENAAELLEQTGVNGLFIGRAAWEVSGFASLIRICLQGAGSARLHPDGHPPPQEIR